MEDDIGLQRILVIDDDIDYRKLLVGFLGEAFAEAEILEHDPASMGMPGDDFNWADYDVLILDYDLRSEAGSGLDILHRHRHSLRFPATIMLTGAGDEDIAVRAMKSGVYDYLRKEKLKKSQLVEAIQGAFEQHISHRQGIETLDAVREMARQQAEQMVSEYKTRYEETRNRQEARLKARLLDLEKELQDKQRVLKQTIAEKEAAEQARSRVREKLENLQARLSQEATGRPGNEQTLEAELASAREQLQRLNRDLSDSHEQQQAAEAELLKANWKKEQEETAQKEFQDDLDSFSREMADQEKHYAQLSERLQRMHSVRAQLKAREKEEESASNQELLNEISGQLGKNGLH